MKNLAFSFLLFFTIPIFCMEIEVESIDDKSEDFSIEMKSLLQNTQFPELQNTEIITLLDGKKSSGKWQKAAVGCMNLLSKGIDKLDKTTPYYLTYQNLGLGLSLGRCSNDIFNIIMYSSLAVIPQGACDGYYNCALYSWQYEAMNTRQSILEFFLRNTIPCAQLSLGLYMAHQLFSLSETSNDCNELSASNILLYSSLSLLALKASNTLKKCISWVHRHRQ